MHLSYINLLTKRLPNEPLGKVPKTKYTFKKVTKGKINLLTKRLPKETFVKVSQNDKIKMTAKEFIGELNGKEVEGELIKTFLYSFIISIAILGIVYFVKFRYIDGFLGKYGLYLLLASISLALITSMIRQVRAYKEFACMSGMMIGMTAGMISGFDIGLYLGATNGMLYGSILGMLVGIFIGIWMGKCCGIMGVMEGLMAGFMGGIMGAMTAVMMINDNLKLAVVIISIVSWVILILLNYMIYKEMKENERQRKEDHTITALITVIIIAIITWFMIYGPRSTLFGG